MKIPVILAIGKNLRGQRGIKAFIDDSFPRKLKPIKLHSYDKDYATTIFVRTEVEIPDDSFSIKNVESKSEVIKTQNENT